jgi:hypothetical protein
LLAAWSNAGALRAWRGFERQGRNIGRAGFVHALDVARHIGQRAHRLAAELSAWLSRLAPDGVIFEVIATTAFALPNVR